MPRTRNSPGYAITITDRTRLQIYGPCLDLTTLRQLECVCHYGLSETLSDSLREAITELVCASINPLRPLPLVTRTENGQNPERAGLTSHGTPAPPARRRSRLLTPA